MTDFDFVATMATLLALGWLAYVLVDIFRERGDG